ncbi:MAG: hypothetical protein K2M76_00875 [Muribaculaceae bacterium]|nr:hypothetical protein [Muribaculaceae bacterium]
MSRLILLLFVITGWASAHAQEVDDVDSIMDETAVTDTVQPTIDYDVEPLPADWYKSTPEWKQ